MKLNISKFPAVMLGLGGTAALAALSIQMTPVTPVKASNHISSPLTAQDRAVDIGDQWAFLDPNDSNYVVLILDTQGFLVSSEHFGMAIFDPRVRYQFAIENDGSAIPSKFINVQYSPGLGRLTTQTATITLPNGQTFTAPTTVATQGSAANDPVNDPASLPSVQDDAGNPTDSSGTPNSAPSPVVYTDPASGVSFFAGVAADPFYLDDTGANRFIASSILHPGHPNRNAYGARGGRDTYAGVNQLITAVRVPVSMLKGTGSVIGVYAATQRQRLQVVQSNGDVVGSGPWVTLDREGNPFVDNTIISAPLKNAYHGASTQDDARGVFVADMTKNLKALNNSDANIAAILNRIQVHGDFLHLDLSLPNSGSQGGSSGPGETSGILVANGGRKLLDNTSDFWFTTIDNQVPITDHVPSKGFRLRDQFPFVSNPYMPYPGGTVDDGTRQ